LTGRGRFIDDLAVRPDTLHAAILRSPHPHAMSKGIDTSAALRADGVAAVLTGADVARRLSPLAMGIRVPIQSWPIAVDRVRCRGPFA
jgi:2-furoyl-CoA dehydrogenase large subunit